MINTDKDYEGPRDYVVLNREARQEGEKQVSDYWKGMYRGFALGILVCATLTLLVIKFADHLIIP